jgi:F0F1-type ATP synthase assembly protein I
VIGRQSPERPSPLQGYVWAARVSQIALGSVMPPLLGYWADSAWGTGPWLLVVGAVLGFALLMLEVVRLAGGGPSQK